MQRDIRCTGFFFRGTANEGYEPSSAGETESTTGTDDDDEKAADEYNENGKDRTRCEYL